MGTNKKYTDPSELPTVLPVFPLAGALVLPRTQLPLNIFEPRYLTMIDDALKSERLVGMIQPRGKTMGSTNAPELHPVGCAGRITQFGETGDGRYLVTLTGICRFRIVDEVTATTPYRQCHVDFNVFADDLIAHHGEEEVDRDKLTEALRAFARVRKLNIDWDEIKRASNEVLVNALTIMSPFGASEKQALLEAASLRERAETLVTITQMEVANPGTNSPTIQ